METITNAALLERIKTANGITGDFHNAALLEHIEEVKFFLEDSGVATAIVNSTAAAGVISRGTMDLWNYGAGGGALSPYFYQRATQLIYKKVPEGE